MSNKKERFQEIQNELYQLNKVYSALHWDQKVVMPHKGLAGRADIFSYLSGRIHSIYSSTELFDLVNELAKEQLDEFEQVDLRQIRKIIDRQRKMPEALVRETAQVRTVTNSVWEQARAENNFKLVSPHLDRLFQLVRQEAECLKFNDCLYDALLDSYQPGLLYADLKPLMLDVAKGIKVLLSKLKLKPFQMPKNSHFPIDRQMEFNTQIVKDLGFDLDGGRIDEAVHPFEASLGLGDIRLTTRYNENDFLSSTLTLLHEAGHGLYEQNLPAHLEGRACAAALDMDMHETISRFYENIIGRSKPYAEYLFEHASKIFDLRASISDHETLWLHANSIEPSLIRVESDEVTYSLHIVIRMLLEEQIVNNTISIADLPEAWNSLYEEYLGLRPDSDRNGVLQDTHWYGGSIGYFPSYALGNLYGAMYLEELKKRTPDFDQRLARGDTLFVLEWMKSNIFSQGTRFTAGELLQKATGRKLEAQPFLNYLNNKLLS